MFQIGESAVLDAPNMGCNTPNAEQGRFVTLAFLKSAIIKHKITEEYKVRSKKYKVRSSKSLFLLLHSHSKCTKSVCPLMRNSRFSLMRNSHLCVIGGA